MKIFVSIAAYRDPELAPTIADCLRRARDPDALRFGVCWQHTDDEPPPALFPRPWLDIRGAIAPSVRTTTRPNRNRCERHVCDAASRENHALPDHYRAIHLRK